MVFFFTKSDLTIAFYSTFYSLLPNLVRTAEQRSCLDPYRLSVQHSPTGLAYSIYTKKQPDWLCDDLLLILFSYVALLMVVLYYRLFFLYIPEFFLLLFFTFFVLNVTLRN